jgi:adenylate kinase
LTEKPEKRSDLSYRDIKKETKIRAKHMDIVAIIAPPLAGKGTQSKKLAEKTGWVHISTGDLLRDRMKGNSKVAKEIRATMKNGAFASPELVDKILKERLAEDDCKAGVILDGYPRTLAQTVSLKSICEEANRNFLGAVFIDVPYSELFNRLAQRGRADDKPELLKNRLKDYENHTKWVAELYQRQGKLQNVDGTLPLQEVADQIYTILKPQP